MGKKRKHEDLDEEKLARKIRKLQDKISLIYEKRNKPTSPVVSSDDDDYAQSGEENSIYQPPSDWVGSYCDGGIPLPDLASEPPSPVRIQEDPSGPEPAPNRSPQPGPSCQSAAPVSTLERDLEDSILTLLGDAPKPETVFGDSIHKDVAARWQEILAKGLSKESKEKLVAEYLIPANCGLLEPPILNPEAKAAMAENLVKRDFSLLSKQKYLAAALAALAQVTEMLVSNDFTREKLLKPVSDASRILCDSHNLETKTRRSFVIASINSKLKGALIDTTRDKYLFGENLTEKLNAAKSIQKSGDTLKNQFKPQQFNKFNSNEPNKPNRLNSRALHPRSMNRFDAGPSRSAAMRAQTTTRTQQARRTDGRPRAPPPQHPPPSHHRGRYNRR